MIFENLHNITNYASEHHAKKTNPEYSQNSGYAGCGGSTSTTSVKLVGYKLRGEANSRKEEKNGNKTWSFMEDLI